MKLPQIKKIISYQFSTLSKKQWEEYNGAQGIKTCMTQREGFLLKDQFCKVR